MTKQSDAPEVRKDRRAFLKFASTAAPLAAVAVATGTTEAQAAAVEPDLSSDKMQDTEHTRAYYASARF
ncbi:MULTISPECIES: twin-arginine translocation pathway signal protein [Roseobacteraceae]|uniref:Formate_TAT: formate dehydrogenase region TAT target n=1 Tax=Pseudosulfitobacter pseudonitzschiae TaxID=1402135 RepID=A0A221K6C3_9RHOB|nr:MULTISPECIES: twin-arginine translocation pathway signal protein [Roseobacteraceae]ASM74551.1 formate_TAT: formate dehydrogenase region TAT target [Pseudosulfitobacter pseudonitzschiae]